MPGPKAWVAISLSVFWRPVAAWPQTTPDLPTFRAQTASVIVDVIVRDRKGNAVPNLTADDFRLFENGVRQKILSVEPPESVKTAGADTPAQHFHRSAPRFATLVIDRSNVQLAGLIPAIKAAVDYVEKVLGPGDYISVYSVGGKLDIVVPFTQDKARAVAGIQSLNRISRKGAYTTDESERDQVEINQLQQDADNATDPVMAALLRADSYALMAEKWMMNTMQARILFRSLRSIAQAYTALPGRKNVVVFSSGFEPTPEDAPYLNAVIDSANRANVAFYVIDPAGVTNPGAPTAAPSPGPRGRLEVALSKGQDPTGGFTQFDYLHQVGIDVEYDELGTIAEKTGGKLIKQRNDLLPELARIDRDLRDYYTLTYQPSDIQYDGSFHKIRVTLERHGCDVRHRSGYWALPPGEERMVTPAAAQLLALASGGKLAQVVTPKLNAALLSNLNGDWRVPVSVWLPGSLAWLSKANGGYDSWITLVLTARDRRGKLAEVLQKTVKFDLPRKQQSDFERLGFRITASLSVPRLEPLELQAVLQFSNGKTAVAVRKLEISEVAGARITSVLVTPRVLTAPPISQAEAEADPLRVRNFELVLPSEPRFAPSERLTLYFGLADVTFDTASGKPLLDAGIAIRSGGKLLRQLDANGFYPAPKAPHHLLFLKQYDLAGLAPGSYTLQAVVRDRAKNTTAVSETNFTIQ